MDDNSFSEADDQWPANDRSAVEVSAEDAHLVESLRALSGLAVVDMDLPALMTKVATYAVQAIPGAEGAGLTLIAEDESETLVATTQFVREVDAIQYGMRQGPCITAASEGMTVLSHSLGDDKRWPEFGAQLDGLGVHSALSLPLIGPDRVVGAMNIYARRRDAFDRRSADFGRRFAVPAAVTVQTALAMARARELATQFETALATRAVIDRAIGVLIASDGISSEEAERRLRAAGNGERHILLELAEEILQNAERRNRDRWNETDGDSR
jgi:GAF domain-containing protein